MDLRPKYNSKESAPPGKSLKGESLREGSESSHLPLWADLVLIGWWGDNRAGLQESGAQPESVSILHLGGAFVPAECKDTWLYIFFKEELGCCPLVS